MMFDAASYDLLYQAIKVVFLTALPVLLVLGISGLLAGVLQAATGINDIAVSYGIKMLALVGLLYFFLPAWFDSISKLAELALR